MADLLTGPSGRTTSNGGSRAGGPTPVGPRAVLEARERRQREAKERQREAQGGPSSSSRPAGQFADAPAQEPEPRPVQQQPRVQIPDPPQEEQISPARPQVDPSSSRRRTSGQESRPRQSQPQAAPSASQPQPQPQQPQPQTQSQSQSQPQPQGARTSQIARSSSFPHAFERWETLSSHWEGLTSYWLRKIEQNKEEVAREPMGKQMARQIQDLSAAGANLFHAVVELQRLRATSERKFQRWFFETRAETERAQEIQGEMENTLRIERNQRAEAVNRAAKFEQEKNNAEKLVAEMRRELQISKEEARRAWEELGRRQEEEQSRITSLRERQPTLVGGIQVFPMTRPSAPSTSSGQGPDTHALHHEPDVTDFPPSHSDSRPLDQPPPKDARRTSQPAAAAAASSSRTQGQPQRQGSDPFYHQPGTSLGAVSDGAYDESTTSEPLDPVEYQIDQDGHYVRDEQGRRIPVLSGHFSEESGDERGHYRPSGSGSAQQARLHPQQQQAQQQQQPLTSATYMPGGTSTAGGAPGRGSGSGSGSTDYSYPPMPERHHHPSRLSDVLEEDEASRTTASRASSHRQPHQ